MNVIPKPKKPLDSLTTYEKEKEVKKLREQNEELIDEMGQTSEKKAAPIVQQYVKELNQEEEDQQKIDEGHLKLASRNKKNYQRYLIYVLHRFIMKESIPEKYKLYVDSSDKGIVIGIQKTDLYAAMAVCGIPKYDIYACKILATKVGNTVAKLEGYVNKNDSGIVLPDREDKKKYGRTS